MGKETASITRSAARVGVATMISRVFGLARDTVFAILFGTGFVADAFNLAVLIPSFFRRIVGEGNLNPAFVPVFTELLERRGRDEANAFLRRFTGLLLVILLAMVALGIVLARPFVYVYAKEWTASPDDFAYAVMLLQILFPSLLFAGAAALATSALNARRRFVIPALSPIMLNLGFLVGAAAAYPYPTLPERAVVFGIGGLVGGLAAWLVQAPAMRSAGLAVRPAWGPRDPDVRRVLRLMGPGLLALGVTQLNLLVDTILALRLDEGSLSALRLGNRLVLLPMGVIGVAVSTAALPALASRAAADDRKALLAALAHSIKLLLTLMVPAAVGLGLLAAPVVTLLFQYGEFTAERSTPMTVSALVFYAIGLPAFGLVRGIAQGFYSVQDTKTPVRIAAVGVSINIALSLILMGPLGLGGLALATAVASWVSVLISLRSLGSRVGSLAGLGFGRTIPKVFGASAALAAGCLAGVAWTSGLGESIPERAAQVGAPIALGLAAMLAAYRGLRHAEMGEILDSLLGKGPR